MTRSQGNPSPWRALGVALALLAGYRLSLRPRLMSWGATAEEARAALPGDDLVPVPDMETTRVIDVDDSAYRVWPWLIQVGYQRAGFYSYDLLEEWAGLRGIRSADRVVPELQFLSEGDQLLISPVSPMEVALLEPGRAMVLQMAMNPFTGKVVHSLVDSDSPCMEWSWGFYLKEPCPGKTRLQIRVRAGYRPIWLAPLFWGLVEPVHFLMEQKMLRGIKERVEGY